MQHDELPPGTPPHNFGPATARDSIVYGSFRPAFSPTTESAGAVEDVDVAAWAKFMQEQGVKRVICLLNDDEMKFYKTPLEQQMSAAGFDPTRWTRAAVYSDGAADTILDAFRAADAAGEKIVVHCSGGSGRTALATGLWLTSKYGLTPEEAAKEIGAHAAEIKTVRNPDVAKLTTFIGKRTLAKK